MTSLPTSLRRLLDPARLPHKGWTMGILITLALLSALTAVTLTETTAGEANLINSTGGLRMLAWRMVSDAAEGQSPALTHSLGEFDRRLEALREDGIRLNTGERATDEAYRQVLAEWQTEVRPLFLSGARPRLLATMPGFVHHLDALVQLIEQDLETKIQWLRWIQGTLLLLIVVVALLTYGRLKAAVADKTRALLHSNHSLQLLYRTTSRLSEGDLTQEKLLDLLTDVEQELGLGQGIICVRQNDESRAYPLATHIPEAERAALCARLGCTICFGIGHPTTINVYQVGGLRLASIPLTGGGQWQGVMPFQLLPGSTLEPWQAQVLETVGHHVATALANTRRAEERHRLAVLEERSAIARELHDSIAQSLSYLKIQIALLQARISDLHHPELLGTVEELKVGLGSAYSELRELLTTFRLAPGQTPFTEELAQMVQELSRRCGFTIELEQHMGSMELSANEEVHLTSIIREALINIQRHACARWARVTLTADTLRRVQVIIEDDGVGLPEALPDRHHFGLTIMRERAACLQGQLQLAIRPEGGTRVGLAFVANTPYAHELAS